MRILMLVLLWLIAASPQAQATDWLSWRNVGSATFTWGPFTLYSAQLMTPDGRYHGPQQDSVLIITYQRSITRDKLVDATQSQWQAQGVMESEPQAAAWLAMLSAVWPDVEPGTQLAFVVRRQQGQFWYRTSAAQKTFTPLGTSQPAAFSARFLAIWLGPDTQYPALRLQLIGGEK